MRQNRISTGENYPSLSAPIWTIPMSRVTLPLTNNNEDLPSYNRFIAVSASQSEDVPPNYFDISIVPNGAVLYYDEVIPYREASKAKTQRKNGNIFSLDSLIDKNPDQLWLYFMTYLNEKPSLFVNILGQHVEYNTSEFSRTSNDLYRIQRHHVISTITDFNYSIDLTPYVSEHYWRIAVIPSKKTNNINENISFREALEEYTRSKKNVKEIQCKKQFVGWNFEELQCKIKDLISSSGYRGDIYIDFTADNYRIIAHSSSKLSRFANSLWTRILCVLSCFCLIFAPIYFCLRALGSTHHYIVADYKMISSIKAFLRMNTKVILRPTYKHSKGRFLAKIAKYSNPPTENPTLTTPINNIYSS